jgi:anti-repressor protein
MSNLVKIEKFMDIDIRYTEGEKPLFMLNDICVALGLKNTTMAKKVIFEEYLSKASFKTNGRSIEANAVTEPGLWQLVMRSNKPDAIRMQKFLYEDLLPKIRKRQYFEGLESREITETGKSFARMMAHR